MDEPRLYSVTYQSKLNIEGSNPGVRQVIILAASLRQAGAAADAGRKDGETISVAEIHQPFVNAL